MSKDIDINRVSSIAASRPETAPFKVDRHPIKVLVIERRAFYRDCVVHAIRSQSDFVVHSAASANEWLQNQNREIVSVVLLCTGSISSDAAIKTEIELLREAADCPAPIVISDVKRLENVVAALSSGAKGLLPTDTHLEIAIGAVRLVSCGGVYVPASTLLEAQEKLGDPAGDQNQLNRIFTTRQIAVIEALRKGKANKTIAYELNMCESTVKVHVRNIMKRLKAKNRTQIAYLASELLSPGDPYSQRP